MPGSRMTYRLPFPKGAAMPFLPFTRPTIDEETIEGVAEVLRSGWIASGPNVKELEAVLSTYLGGRTVQVMTSATEALEIALRVAGIGPGDEVITPAMSFVATANTISRVGARPVFVDVDLATRNMDMGLTEAAITPRTKALMPVHFAGLPVDMDRLYALAGQHKLRVIEDAAHAIGSRYRGRRIGSFGDLVVFSFHPNKNITTIEGGAIVGADGEERRAVELHRFHGQAKDENGDAEVYFPGSKSNLSDVAARVGLGQLPHLEEWNAKRRTLVARYFEKLRPDPPMLLPATSDEGHSWHVFTPLLPLNQLTLTRAEFIREMHQREIGVGVHYPAVHLFRHYRGLGYRDGDFPNAERIGRETVTIPLFPAMNVGDVDRVCHAIAAVLKAHRR
jgi:dTDP-4-amino-4,6-dideoxygalactose transaminase